MEKPAVLGRRLSYEQLSKTASMTPGAHTGPAFASTGVEPTFSITISVNEPTLSRHSLLLTKRQHAA